MFCGENTASLSIQVYPGLLGGTRVLGSLHYSSVRLCFRWMLSKPSLIKGVAVPSSLSSEEMSHEHILLEAADSGRGSWTSCSSSSHDNFQSLPNPKSWDFLNTYRHTHLDDPIAEVEPTDCEPCACSKGGCSRTCGQCKGSLETSQLRQSWASSSSLSDTYEPNYGTIKRRVLESAPAEAPGGLETRDTTDPVYKTVTSSTDRGLIGKYKFVCITGVEGLCILSP